MFTAITSGEIASGEPVSTTTQTKIKDDLDDHEARIEALEISTLDFPAIIMRVNGNYGESGILTGVLKTTVNLALSITGIRILTDVAGSSGTVEIDILRKRGGGSYESLLTTKPSVSHTAGNDALSTNAVLDSSKVDLLAGDILRMDITSVQTGDESGFLVRLDYTR